MDNKVKLLFFNVPEKLPLVAELVSHYQRKQDYEVNTLKEASEVLREVASAKNGIVIFKVENKVDLQLAVGFLKSAKKLIKKGLVRPACLSFFKSKKVETILQKYGCIDILDPGTLRAKNASFKIDFWSKNIRAQLKKTEKELSFRQNTKETQAETVEEKKDGFVSAPALDLASDIWISKHKNDHKRVLRRYLSRLLGPSPHVGHWVELESKPNDKQASWKFALKDEEAQFILDDGNWYFSGSKPEFDWKIQRWIFSADKPHLYFYSEDGKVHSRIKFKDGQVVITENSTYALTKEHAIEETCQSKFAFEGDKAGEEESNTAHGSDNAIDGKLRGDVEEGEHIDDHWDGETSSDDLGEDKIRGKLSHEQDEEDSEKRARNGVEEYEGHYGGKGKTDHIDNDPYSGDVDEAPGDEKEQRKSKFSEADKGGFYDGKSRTDEYGSDPLEQNLRPGEEKEREAKRSEFDEEDLGGNYGGKSSTDEIDRDPLSGDLKPQAKDAKNSRGSEFSEADKGGHYDGKSRTDEYGSEPLEQELKPGSEKEQADKRGNFAEDDLGGNYGGKSSTDEIDRDPLSGDLKPQSRDSKNGHGGEFSEADKGGHYDGKSRTDEYGSEPLAQELKPGKKKEQGNNRTEFTEDDLGGHYGGRGETDEIDRDPLAGALKPQKKTSDGADDSEFSEDDLGGHYGGKAKTDELDRDPLKGELKPGRAKEENSGRTSLKEDDLGGHYGGARGEAEEKDPKRRDDASGEMDDIYGRSDDEGDGELDRDHTDALGRPGREKNASLESGSVDVYDDGVHSPGLRSDDESERPAHSRKNNHSPAAGMDRGDDDSLEDKEIGRDFHDLLKATKKNGVIGKAAGEDESPLDQVVDRKDVAEKESAGAPEVRERKIHEALGGGLTEDADRSLKEAGLDDKVIQGGKKAFEQKKELAPVIETAPNVSTESGELRVVLRFAKPGQVEMDMICTFEDFFPDELVVVVPKGDLPMDTEVSATVRLDYGGKKHVVKTEGKVAEIEEFRDDKECVIIALDGIDENEYESFMELYEERQGNIHEFMKLAKGYE